MTVAPQSPPAEIALVHAFVNTLDLRSFSRHGARHESGDEIATADDLTDWLRAHDLIDATTAASEADLHDAHELRTRLRAGVGDEDEPHLPPLDLDLQLDATPGQPPALVPAGDGIAAALARIALTAVRATATGAWQRLKVCAAPDCHWIFYDHTRPGRGRWCAPELCGNRMKTRAYRQRQH